MRIDDDFTRLLQATISLQRDVAQAMELVVNVLRGPDPTLREMAVNRLASLAAEMYASTARLEELQ